MTERQILVADTLILGFKMRIAANFCGHNFHRFHGFECNSKIYFHKFLPHDYTHTS